MLYRLGQEVLSRLIFPLGEFLSKEDTRELARERHLRNADKKDSQEICFIDQTDNYVDYITTAGYTSAPGNFVDRDGNVLARTAASCIIRLVSVKVSASRSENPRL